VPAVFIKKVLKVTRIIAYVGNTEIQKFLSIAKGRRKRRICFLWRTCQNPFLISNKHLCNVCSHSNYNMSNWTHKVLAVCLLQFCCRLILSQNGILLTESHNSWGSNVISNMLKRKFFCGPRFQVLLKPRTFTKLLPHCGHSIFASQAEMHLTIGPRC